MLDERKRRILQAIVDDYVSTAEPVGSRTIARKYDLGVSPATIRNEMADLEVLGFLEQLHTSSGRIPSAKGYRFYVDALLSPTQMSEKEISLIRNWYQAKVRRLDEVFQTTAKILSRMTGNVSLVLAPQASPSSFKYLQFLPFDENKVLLVVVSDSGAVENKLLPLPKGTTLEEMQLIAEKLNNRLAGIPFRNFRGRMFQDVRDSILGEAREFEEALSILADTLSSRHQERVYLGGATQMLNQPEFKDVEKFKRLLNMLEEERLLYDILEAPSDDGVVVTIGRENKFSGIQDCSMVRATYCLGGEVVGTIAVLGPTRMDYAKIMATLEFMNHNLSEILKHYKL